jgi:hypothetical protein
MYMYIFKKLLVVYCSKFLTFFNLLKSEDFPKHLLGHVIYSLPMSKRLHFEPIQKTGGMFFYILISRVLEIGLMCT